MKFKLALTFIEYIILIFFLYLVAIFRGFSIEAFGWTEEYSNVLSIVIAVVGILAIAVSSLEIKRNYLLRKIEKFKDMSQ